MPTVHVTVSVSSCKECPQRHWLATIGGVKHQCFAPGGPEHIPDLSVVDVRCPFLRTQTPEDCYMEFPIVRAE